MSAPPGNDERRPRPEAPPHVVSIDTPIIDDELSSALDSWPATVFLACRIPGCDLVAEVTQRRLDHLIATRPGSHDLCGVHYAKYAEYEAGVA